jgi:mannose-1-phosphate guanylyltransferase
MAGIEGRFVVLNGDIYVDFDFHAAFQEHVSFRADLTLALHEEDDPSAFGVAVVDAEGLVTGFVEKPPRGEAPSLLVNAGVWIFEPGLVDEIPAGAVRVEETLFPSLVARQRRVLGYRFEGRWADLGTPQRYLELSRDLLGEANAIAADARVAPGAVVAGSAVGAGTRIADGARVTGSILWEGVSVETGAMVDGCILADGVVVEAGAQAVGVIAGKGARIGAGVSVPRGTSIEAGGRYDGTHG